MTYNLFGGTLNLAQSNLAYQTLPRVLPPPPRSTQPCIPPASPNRVPALIGWGKGGNVTSAGWQVTLCDPVWHVSSRSGEAVCELLYSASPFYFLPLSVESLSMCTMHGSVKYYMNC